MNVVRVLGLNMALGLLMTATSVHATVRPLSEKELAASTGGICIYCCTAAGGALCDSTSRPAPPVGGECPPGCSKGNGECIDAIEAFGECGFVVNYVYYHNSCDDYFGSYWGAVCAEGLAASCTQYVRYTCQTEYVPKTRCACKAWGEPITSGSAWVCSNNVNSYMCSWE